jgi:YHS domain-containing protein
MAVDAAMAPKSVYRDVTYNFCSGDHKALFDRSPAEFVALIELA